MFGVERIKWIRIQLGETQAAFARRIGVDPDMISRYENGHVKPLQARVIKALLEAEKEAEA